MYKFRYDIIFPYLHAQDVHLVTLHIAVTVCFLKRSVKIILRYKHTYDIKAIATEKCTLCNVARCVEGFSMTEL